MKVLIAGPEPHVLPKESPAMGWKVNLLFSLFRLESLSAHLVPVGLMGNWPVF
jgi:hypothetical protein